MLPTSFQGFIAVPLEAWRTYTQKNEILRSGIADALRYVPGNVHDIAAPDGALRLTVDFDHAFTAHDQIAFVYASQAMQLRRHARFDAGTGNGNRIVIDAVGDLQYETALIGQVLDFTAVLGPAYLSTHNNLLLYNAQSPETVYVIAGPGLCGSEAIFPLGGASFATAGGIDPLVAIKCYH